VLKLLIDGKRPLDSSGGNNLFDPVVHGLTFKSENGPSAADCTRAIAFHKFVFVGTFDFNGATA
jgi:hypothetical protein